MLYDWTRINHPLSDLHNAKRIVGWPGQKRSHLNGAVKRIQEF